MLQPGEIGFLPHQQASEKYIVPFLPRLRRPRITSYILETSCTNNSKGNENFYFLLGVSTVQINSYSRSLIWIWEFWLFLSTLLPISLATLAHHLMLLGFMYCMYNGRIGGSQRCLPVLTFYNYNFLNTFQLPMYLLI